jgi:hypothetical protein
MMVVVAAAVACGQPARPAQQPRNATSPALVAMQQGKFDDALRESTAMLARDPRSSQAAAVHAIASYQHSATKLAVGLRGVLAGAEMLHAFDHERGRAVWRTFLDELEGIDRDLAIAAADPDFALELCPACWEPHDWNMNGRIDDQDQHLFELEFDGKGGVLPPDDRRRKPTYRFDHGDILWARAMISFQRAGVELVLAYRWSELDKLFTAKDDRIRISIKLVDRGRVNHARELVLAGLTFADQTREAYLAETDDDREWVPNPRQKSYAMPLEVPAELYTAWAIVTRDVRHLLESKEGLSLREVATAILGPRGAGELPNAYVDVGRMLREPTDLVIDIDDSLPRPQMYERALRGMLGNGYAESMRASPLVGRLRHMADDVLRGSDTLDRKLRYMFWLN